MLQNPGRARLSAVVLLVGTALSACGFQLRGATAVPDALNPLYVACQADTPAALCEQVRELLALNEVTVLEEPQDNAYILQLQGLGQNRRATAITDSAGAAEYELRLEAALGLTAPGDIPLLAGAQVIASETYRYDEDNVLAKRREQENLIEQLYQRLAQQIVFRLMPYTAERIAELRAQHPSKTPPPAKAE